MRIQGCRCDSVWTEVACLWHMVAVLCPRHINMRFPMRGRTSLPIKAALRLTASSASFCLTFLRDSRSRLDLATALTYFLAMFSFHLRSLVASHNWFQVYPSVRPEKQMLPHMQHLIETLCDTLYVLQTGGVILHQVLMPGGSQELQLSSAPASAYASRQYFY